MAVSTAMSICKIVFQTSFFISFSFLFQWFNIQKEIGQVCTPVVFPLRFLVVNFPFAVLNEWQCSLSSNTVQRYKKNRQNAIVVLNHVHPCPESCASLSRIPCIPLSSPSSWRRAANCIPTYRPLHRHVSPAASPRSFRGHRAHGYFLCGLAGGQKKMQKCESECEFEMFFNVT